MIMHTAPPEFHPDPQMHCGYHNHPLQGCQLYVQGRFRALEGENDRLSCDLTLAGQTS